MKITDNYKAASLIFAIMLLAYLLTAKGYLTSSDSELSMLTAESLALRGEFALPEGAKSALGFTSPKNGRKYSKYGVGLPFLWVPAVWWASLISACTDLPAETLARFLASFYNIFFGAGVCAVLFLLARQLGASSRKSAIMVLLFGFGTMAWHYAIADFSEMTRAFFLLAAVLGCLKGERVSVITGGAAFGAMVLIKLADVIYLPFFLVFLFFDAAKAPWERVKLTAWFLAGPLLSASIIIVINQLRFGSILETGYGGEVQLFSIGRIPKTLLWLLLGSEKGLFFYSPILLVGLWGYRTVFRRNRRMWTLLLALTATNLLFYAAWWSPQGGWAYGPRFQVPILAFLALPIAFIPIRGWFSGSVLGLLAAASITLQAVSVMQNYHEYLHLRYDEPLIASQSDKIPGPIRGNIHIFWHKLSQGGNIYPVSLFGIPGAEQVSTHRFETYRGLNLWYAHIARYTGHAIWRYLWVLGIPFLVILFRRLFQLVKDYDSWQS